MNDIEEVKRVKQRFGIIGNTPALIAAVQRAVKVAPIDLSVLVTGESGSGKEFFPKIIHQWSARKHRKYIAVNCGAIPEGTIDSELFGHEKGSFTGAISARKGYFEEANGGTIFLDEVAELPLTTQARLLRVLESGEYLKVGSSDVQKTDIRIVAATNVDLTKSVAEGKFREDLYYRLSTIQIHVPSLHDRGEDIELLARKFAYDFSEKYMTKSISFGSDAVNLMHAYRWPGNVRQLKNVVEQLALFHAGDEVTSQDVSECLPRTSQQETMLAKPDRGAAYDGERELLWQMVLSMKAELNALKEQLGGNAVNEDSDIRSVKNYQNSRMPAIPLFKDGGIFSNADDSVLQESHPYTLEDSERDAILKALERNAGSRKKAAAELRISERTLYRKLKEYHII
jgi:DNA-binding NtrC family response regulator